MATIPHYVFDNNMVALRKAQAIVVCAMEAAGNKVLDRSQDIDYALWQASDLLEDVIFNLEDQVSFEKTGHMPEIESIKEQIVEIVERFNHCPVVIPPNESFVSQIIEAIREADIE